jgi:hypothetical protein
MEERFKFKNKIGKRCCVVFDIKCDKIYYNESEKYEMNGRIKK